MKEALRAKVLVAFNAVNLGIVEIIIKGAIRAIDFKRDLASQRKLEIFALLSREEGVFATFQEAREIIKEFLEETSYPRVKDAYDRVEDAADALEGQMLTSGQKEDAKDFGAAIKNELAQVFRTAEDAYKEFARKHEYLFFGPLGSGYYQERWRTTSGKNERTSGRSPSTTSLA